MPEDDKEVQRIHCELLRAVFSQTEGLRSKLGKGSKNEIWAVWAPS